MPTTKQEDTTGSWFSSGYYGHTRNRPRSDFVCEYRHLAKPQPPVKFVSRSLHRGTKHPFSHHDNRNAFLCDAVYFEQGLGRRKLPAYAPVFHRDFYTWMPMKQQYELSLPHLSTYQVDFTTAQGEVQQMLLAHPPTSDCLTAPPDTTYHYQYCTGCPHKGQMRMASQVSEQLTTSSRAQVARRNPAQPLESVASCLSWHRSKQSSKVEEVDTSNNAGSLVLPQLASPPPTEKPQRCFQPVSPQPVWTSQRTAMPEVRPVPLQAIPSKSEGTCLPKCPSTTHPAPNRSSSLHSVAAAPSCEVFTA